MDWAWEMVQCEAVSDQVVALEPVMLAEFGVEWLGGRV
jgi:hypothetical protein